MSELVHNYEGCYIDYGLWAEDDDVLPPPPPLVENTEPDYNDDDILPPAPTLADVLAEEREVERATANQAEDDDLLPLPTML